MLIFFDESFRQSLSEHKKAFGALCGIAIPEKELSRISKDIFQLKQKHFGTEFAENSEIKGKDLLKNYVFTIEEKYGKSDNLEFAIDLVNYIASRRLYVFGCVCFEKEMHHFKCEDVRALDSTFRYIFERVDMFMKVKHKDQLAKIIFDDRDYGINKKNSTAITNFFQRSERGRSLDSIVKTPFFAISQAQNIGLQLADFVTTIIGLRFASHPKIQPYFDLLKPCFFTYDYAGKRVGSIKLLRGATIK